MNLTSTVNLEKERGGVGNKYFLFVMHERKRSESVGNQLKLNKKERNSHYQLNRNWHLSMSKYEVPGSNAAHNQYLGLENNTDVRKYPF